MRIDFKKNKILDLNTFLNCMERKSFSFGKSNCNKFGSKLSWVTKPLDERMFKTNLVSSALDMNRKVV